MARVVNKEELLISRQDLKWLWPLQVRTKWRLAFNMAEFRIFGVSGFPGRQVAGSQGARYPGGQWLVGV